MNRQTFKAKQFKFDLLGGYLHPYHGTQDCHVRGERVLNMNKQMKAFQCAELGN